MRPPCHKDFVHYDNPATSMRPPCYKEVHEALKDQLHVDMTYLSKDDETFITASHKATGRHLALSLPSKPEAAPVIGFIRLWVNLIIPHGRPS